MILKILGFDLPQQIFHILPKLKEQIVKITPKHHQQTHLYTTITSKREQGLGFISSAIVFYILPKIKKKKLY